MQHKKNTIFLVAGETSGDILGGYLATALTAHYPEYTLSGVGSQRMRNAGVNIIMDSEQLAVVGFIEVLWKLSTIRQAMRMIINALKKEPPALLILIDYPGFNLRLAAKAKTLGINIMYYVSPQIWAWHYSRIKHIKKNIDLMAVLFPFEEKIYRAENVPVKFVGHPLLENLKPSPKDAATYEAFNLTAKQTIIGILPGSRQHEIKRLLADMLAAIPNIRHHIPNAQFVLLLAPNLENSILNEFNLEGVNVIQHHTRQVLPLCDATIVTSGTMTLEVAMLGIPQVIVYRLNTLTYHLAKRLAKVKHFGLCNIVAEHVVARELLQHQVTPATISKEIIALLNDSTYRQSIQQHLETLQHTLRTNNAAKKAADAAISVINRAKTQQ